VLIKDGVKLKFHWPPWRNMLNVSNASMIRIPSLNILIRWMPLFIFRANFLQLGTQKQLSLRWQLTVGWCWDWTAYYAGRILATAGNSKAVCGQAYDGASNMSRSKNGCQAIDKRRLLWSFTFTVLFCHLNPAVVSTCQKCTFHD